MRGVAQFSFQGKVNLGALKLHLLVAQIFDLGNLLGEEKLEEL